MTYLPLTKIGFFNPGRLSDAEIEQSFVSRISFFQMLFDKIVSEAPNSIPQHYLVIGQRGMGKTSLLVRIAAELRKVSFREKFIPLSFPEEQYNIDRLSKFWLNCMDALADALDKEKNSKELEALDIEIGRLSKIADLDPNDVYESFKKWSQSVNRRPVLLIDNLNLIFEKINIEEQHQLRAILMSNGAPILVGASATSIDETTDYGAPFYDAFQISYLKKLSLQESLDILFNLGRITGTPNFESEAYKHKGRLEALYQLTGGTPRTLAILFPLIQNGFSISIQTDLDALLDFITPLYKARFEELSAQLQVVMDAIALHWDPISIDQLRTVTRLENPQLSPQLKRLTDAGWLNKMDAYETRGNAYELSERFFNIWYLMRRSSRRQKRELYCLTKFLEVFYGEGLHDIARQRLLCKNELADHVTMDLALADAVKDDLLADQLRQKSYTELVEIGAKEKGVLSNFNVPSEITDKKIDELFQQCFSFYNNQNYDAALDLMRKALNINKNLPSAWDNIGVLTLDTSNNYAEAEHAHKRAIELDDSFANPWYNLGVLYRDTKNFKDAEVSYKKAVKLDESYIIAWDALGQLYAKDLERYQEAEAAFKKAISLDESYSKAWYNLANLYTYDLKRYADAEVAYKKALNITQNDAFVWRNLGFLLHRCLKRYEEAEAAYQQAININGNDALVWENLGNLYQNQLHLYQQALQAYTKALKLDDQNPNLWCSLGDIYIDLKRYEEAESSYKKAVELDEANGYPWNGLGYVYYKLNKYELAETAYKKAIEIDEADKYSWNDLGNLYAKNIINYELAESAYKKAIEIDANYASAWHGLGYIYIYGLKRYEDAEIALQNATRLYEKSSGAWNLLADLYQFFLKKFTEAEQAYKKAIQINDTSAYTCFALGNLCHFRLGKYSDAEHLYLQAIKIDDTSHYFWTNLGNLYHYHLKRFKDAEDAYKKSLQVEAKSKIAWNSLGNLYQDNLHQYSLAENAYLQVLTLEPHELYASYNLVFLWRDKMNKYEEAKALFKSLELTDTCRDSYYLNAALFDFYDNNIGNAASLLEKALAEIGEVFPGDTEDDWYRSAVAVIKLGYGKNVLDVFAKKGADIIFRPFYVAIDALTKNEDELFFNSVAAEVREPAKQIVEKMKGYMNAPVL